MSTISSETPGAVPDRRVGWRRLEVPEMWAALAIAVMWLAVLFDALFGPNIISSNAGTSSAVVPSCIVLAFFAYLGTWVVARRGFGRRDDHDA